MNTIAPSLSLLSTAQADRLREFFFEAGYDESGLKQALGTSEPPLPQLRNLPRFLDLTRKATLINHLSRWFLLSQPIAEESVRSTIPAWFLESCLELGLLRIEGSFYKPGVLIRPYGGLLVTSDRYAKPGEQTPYDHVLPINPSARHTLNFTIRQPSRATLDLGAGCGIQALAAARHSETVWATDLNPRATVFARFNALLNGFGNVTCLTGDLFEPVEGRRFDQIVSCPPFVLAPSKEFLYRDNDMNLDQFCRHLAREAPAFLNEGGYFQMITEWVSLEGQSWQDRISEWFEGSDCDVWVLKHYSRSPDDYAQMRMREAYRVSTERDNEIYSAWMDYYRRERVAAMHGGLVTMRRRSKTQWFVLEELNQSVNEPVGDAILSRFAVRDFLDAHQEDRELLAMTPRLSPDARLEQDSRPDEGRWHPLAPVLRRSSGLRPHIGLQPEVADFVVRLDGASRLDDLIHELTAGIDVDPERVKAECLSVVRLLLERGFLIL